MIFWLWIQYVPPRDLITRFHNSEDQNVNFNHSEILKAHLIYEDIFRSSFTTILDEKTFWDGRPKMCERTNKTCEIKQISVNSEGKKHLWRPGHKWEDENECFKESGLESAGSVYLTIVSVIMKLRFPYKATNSCQGIRHID